MSNINGIVSMLQNKSDRLQNELTAIRKEFDEYKKESVKWSVEDIQDRARHLRRICNKTKGKWLLRKMIHEHDASIGINWEVIDSYIQIHCFNYKR